MSDDAQQWICYLRFEQGPPATVVVDLAARDASQQERLPCCTTLQLRLEDVDQYGFPSPEEQQRYVEAEDAVLEALQECGHCRHVGGTTGQGRRSLCWYAPEEAAPDETIRQVMNRFPHVQYELETKPDPHWNQYQSLLPTAAEYQVFLDDQLLHRLREAGDRAEVPRNVEHWIYFPDAESRQRFSQRVQELGFQVKSQQDEAENHLPFELVVQHAISMEPARVHETTLRLLTLAEKCGGRYDGWETTIQREAT